MFYTIIVYVNLKRNLVLQNASKYPTSHFTILETQDQRLATDFKDSKLSKGSSVKPPKYPNHIRHRAYTPFWTMIKPKQYIFLFDKTKSIDFCELLYSAWTFEFRPALNLHFLLNVTKRWKECNKIKSLKYSANHLKTASKKRASYV